MLKILLASLSGAICGRAIAANDGMLAGYWFLVGLYWLINFVEEVTHEC